MALRSVREGTSTIIEGAPEESILSKADDVVLVIEACLAEQTDCALLYSQNLPLRFFDLSSGDAGTVLQKLRNYGLRLAVVRQAGGERFSTHFGEMVAEEARGRSFGVFENREAALAWLLA
jgi:hypothetical protein